MLIATVIIATVALAFGKDIKFLLDQGDYAKKAEDTKKINAAAATEGITTDVFLLATSWEQIKYFVPGEFDSRFEPGSGSQMEIDFVSFLDASRGRAGIPFHITSGFRTPEHNASIKHNGKQYSSKHSPHMQGIAADISFNSLEDTLTALKSLVEVREQYFPEWKLGIGFYKTQRAANSYFIHVDNRKHRTVKRDALWFSDHYIDKGPYLRVPKDQQEHVKLIWDNNKP